VTRFCSGFYSRQRKGKPRYNIEWTEQELISFSIFNSPQKLASSLNNSSPEIMKKAQYAMKSIQHVSDSYWNWFVDEDTFKSRVNDIIFIGKQETFNTDLNELINLFNIDYIFNKGLDPVTCHKNPLHKNYYLSEDAIMNLKEWYKKDYHFLKMIQEDFNFLGKNFYTL
jgi:hypothetical protein